LRVSALKKSKATRSIFTLHTEWRGKVLPEISSPAKKKLNQVSSTAAAMTVVQRPFLSPSADCVM
jgi:hypothetical protein